MGKYIATVFTDSHLPQALTLWESMQAQGDGWKFVALRIGLGGLPESVPAEFAKACIDYESLPSRHQGVRFWY
jgi:hypothetical protein